MKRGISSLSFSGPLEKKIFAAATAGFAGIEIFREDLIYFDGSLSDVAGVAAEAGIEILSLQSLRDFEAAPDEHRKWNLKRAGRFLDLAAETGAPMLIVCANTQPDTVDDADRAAADLALLADMASERGLRVGYEALSTSHCVRTYWQAWQIIEKADRTNLGLVFGAVHSFAMEVDFAPLEDIDPARIFLVHLADAPTTKMDIELLSRHFRLFPGQGNLPVTDLYKLLRSMGYDGPVSMEIFNDQVRAMPAHKVAEDGIRAFHLLEETATEVASLPVVQDIGFIEFACEGKDAADLKRLLEAMGFVHSHRHKSKDVSLYRQGGINLVVNEQPDSPAHSFYLLHGLSVCGLAFHVDKLPTMVERVGLFQGGTIGHLAQPGELDIPAIRGLGGSMIYFLDGGEGAPAFYDVDFVEVADHPPAEGNGLRDIDHFSQAVAPTEFLSSLLYYCAMFGFESNEQLDVLDPHGTVRSRNISNDNGRIRMSLNASIGPNTTTQRFLAKNILASYHHFAFTCVDIFAYADTLDQDIILQAPANYYDDLPRRFDLEPQAIRDMKARNILYDQDADGGAYFQIFTRDVNGLFLEVIQRDGYTGLGAANAPVRMAAQSRDYEQVQNLCDAMRNG